MGGGDLNMKKSWHPLLLKNQERVWLEEKKALEEKKKLDQLRKEKEEERQLQELQRLQEEQTGKKRTEKLEWMYSTPATGSTQNPNDLEDYLLGKKRVDKMLSAEDNAKVGAAHKNFIAVQNANNARDIASKIRDDPLLAIKQQEQAAYQALLSNPLRLREMQERNGVKPKKDKSEKKKEKEERRREKEERRRRRHEGKERRRRSSRSPDTYRRSRSSRSPDARRRSASPRDRGHQYDERSRRPVDGYRRDDRDRSTHRRPSISSSHPPPSGSYGRSDTSSPEPHHKDDRNKRQRSRSRSPQRDAPYVKRSRVSSPPPPPRHYDSRPPRDAFEMRPPHRAEPRATSSGPPQSSAAADRAARLAAMQQDAGQVEAERRQRLEAMLEKEKAELLADDRARTESKGMSSYLSFEQKRVFGGTGGLEDRIRRGKGGMVVDAD